MRLFNGIECTKNKILEANTSLECNNPPKHNKNVILCFGLEESEHYSNHFVKFLTKK